MDTYGEKKYTFLVHTEATKSQIKEAVEKMFAGTKVEKVNTMNMDGKNKRVRGTYNSEKQLRQEAIVQLQKIAKISRSSRDCKIAKLIRRNRDNKQLKGD